MEKEISGVKEKMIKKVCDTMSVLANEEKEIDYIVFKIGDKVFSTNYADIKEGLIKGNIQVVDTKGIGIQTQLWVKGKFTEEKDHKILQNQEPFEINIYFHEKEGEKR